MKSHARVVVIGGGIAGCSVLYHLTREGWADVMLLERDELTSGSTWHAAAQVTQFGGNQTMVALKRHSIDLYRELAADPDHPISYHITGGMRLAHTQDQLDTYHHYVDMAAGMGVDMEVISAKEAGIRHPLMKTQGLLGAWWDPLDGDIDPAGITFALARKAREAGAEINRFTPVANITRKASGEFVVHTEKGDVICEMVVNATGYRVNEVGNMLGVTHPVTSMEHMYFLTEPLAELEALDHRVPIIRDPGDDFYSRQEKNGLLVGIYEQSCKTFGIDGIDPSFTSALCPSDLDRCLDNMEGVFERLPALADTGIHTVINGPITYTIDGAPLIGPIPGVHNAFCAIGLRAGIGESGGHGKLLAQMMVHGECEWDAWFLDPRRFTSYATTEHTRLKAIEDYQNEFHYHLPHEHRPAARLARTTPLYTSLSQLDCDWGVVNGWERALFFKPDASFEDVPGYRFNATKNVVQKEVEALSTGVGMMEVSGFNRYEIEGLGVAEFLDKMICGKLPTIIGKVALVYLLTEKGNILSEATVVKLGEDRYWYGSAAAAEWHDRDWLMQHKPASVTLTELTNSWTILVLAGPKSRELLQSVSPRQDYSKAAFPWLHARDVMIGHARAIAMSVSFSGELAFELHIPNEQLLVVWNQLTEAGKAFNLSHFGLYATESMRMEKGYRHWKADLTYENNPIESGLSRFVNLDKPNFVGKAALVEQIENGPQRVFVSLTHDCKIAAAHAGCPIFMNAEGTDASATNANLQQIGTVTSGAYGHRTGLNIAYAFVDPKHLLASTPDDKTAADWREKHPLMIGILGERYPARIVSECLYDPTYALVKS